MFFQGFFSKFEKFPSPINRCEVVAILFTKFVKSSKTLANFSLKKPSLRKGRVKREKQKFKGENPRGCSDSNKEHKKKFEKNLEPIVAKWPVVGKTRKGKRKVERESVVSGRIR